MTDLIGIGASGVLAYRDALAVIGDNVANAQTPGYVRRTLALRIAPAGGTSGPLTHDAGVGSGVRPGAVARADDALRTANARNAASDAARLTTRADWLTRLQAVVAPGGGGLTARLGGFFDAATTLAATPAAPAARTAFLSSADALAAQFRTTGAGLAGLAADLRGAATADARQVNDLTANLAAINLELKRTGASGEAANALLDSRDKALAALGTLVRVNSATGPDGGVTVRLGEGSNAPLLVDGGAATRVGIAGGAGMLALVLDPTGDATALRLPPGGSLAGLIEADRRIASAATMIDGLAARTANAVNSQSALGVDATGADGAPLFATQALVTTADGGNAGSATLAVVTAADAPIAATGYRMRFDGMLWSLARGDGSGGITGPGALTLDGVTATPAAGARTGDGFTLATTQGAAGLALRALAAPQVAAAGRWLTDAGVNRGSVAVHVTTDPSATALPTLPAYRIDVTGASTANIVDPATNTVLAAVAIDGNSIAGAGFRLTLTGVGAPGDSFRIGRTPANSSDNRNIQAIAALRAEAGPGGTIEASLDTEIGSVAGAVSATNSLASGAAAVAADAARAADAVSGVDLDAQAAELQQLQAAYKASSQVIQTARDLFDTLLAAVH